MQVLFIDLCVASLLIFYFLPKKRNQEPTQLKLKEHGPTRYSAVTQMTEKPYRTSTATIQQEKRFHSCTAQEEIILNTFFEYQGIQRDAFQVLELPAGSSYSSAQRAFRCLSARKNDPSLVLALEAVKKHYGI